MTAIHDITKEIAKVGPRNLDKRVLTYIMYSECKRMVVDQYLVVSFKVIVENIHADGEITGVVGIGSVPALRTKLPSLHHNSMEVD